ncbi:HAD-IIIA family hydrolase [Pseudohalioglobus sediminis]|uniref:3-deoxy-D-manno-octulosonate 8-phosphate phosphatase KdsC n=1 Tax=Pseudohalioglobus sediminis TaxID=2606449 RepID=A0A5B0X3B2_9GAMM|nr:HAD-IIIA family hydrolase [Pseudohalioglobus sediminis]KAA1192781.1 HAD-IIIA family hydrolase [Pseudohalioglobus sediminis]
MTISAQTAGNIELLALDVDGVLTDGRIFYGNSGEELKSFSIKDGLGIKLLQRDGIEVVLITGRDSHIVSRRAAELGITEVIQGREDKLTALREVCAARAIQPAQCAYMGDDLPDLAAVRAAGIGMAPADAAAPLRESADWVSERPGGAGAVREACEMLLSRRGTLLQRLADYD